VQESPNVNSTGIQAGHADHTGPVWDDTLKAQHIKWGDIIPPINEDGVSGSVSIPVILPFTFDGLNWNDAGIAIYNNNCDPVTTTTTTGPPESPTTTTTTSQPATSSNVIPPAGGTTTTTTTPATKPAIAFTGANSWATAAAGLALIGLGSGLVLFTRRRGRHARQS
jgi:hypothetical protein